MDVQVLDQRQVTKYHLSQVRLREFVWVGGHVTVMVGWASGPSVLISRGQGAVDVGGPVAPSGRASGCEGAQECTQIDENGLSELFWDIRIIPTNEPMRSTFRKTPLDVG